MKRCTGILINGIDVGMSIKEELDALMMAIRRCIVKSCFATSINGIDIGMSIKEELDTFVMAII